MDRRSLLQMIFYFSVITSRGLSSFHKLETIRIENGIITYLVGQKEAMEKARRMLSFNGVLRASVSKRFISLPTKARHRRRLRARHAQQPSNPMHFTTHLLAHWLTAIPKRKVGSN